LQQPVVLVMGGGIGIGPMTDLMARLADVEPQLQVVFVAGSNVTLRKRLTRMAEKSHHRVHVLGYTNGVAALMGAADLLISKPGGLTCSEAMAMELPMCIIDPIPGHEEENAAYLEQTGIATWAKDLDQVVQVLRSLSPFFPSALPGNLAAIRRLRRPLATREIAEITLNGLGLPQAVGYLN
jgi:processive 1,2-diacylglycerol beta-glucosyltransferase